MWYPCLARNYYVMVELYRFRRYNLINIYYLYNSKLMDSKQSSITGFQFKLFSPFLSIFNVFDVIDLQEFSMSKQKEVIHGDFCLTASQGSKEGSIVRLRQCDRNSTLQVSDSRKLIFIICELFILF